MSGVVGPEWVDVTVGLAVDMAWKTSLPLAAGLLLSHLPGTAAAKHLRMVVACATVPIMVVTAVFSQSDVAVWTDAPVWPLVAWAIVAAGGTAGMLRALRLLRELPTVPLTSGVESSDHVHTPIMAGWWSPRIIVPSTFPTWQPTAQRAALLHERAHIERRDWLVHMGVWALSIVLWFNPLMWWTRKRMALLAECAADDRVVSSGIAPADYASQLLALARPGPRAALSFSTSLVGRRIRAVLDERSRSGASTVSGMILAVLFVAVGVRVSLVESWERPAVVHGCLPMDASANLGPVMKGPPLLGPEYLPYLNVGE